MYKKGDVYIDEDYSGRSRHDIVLPHSCDEWVIGSPKEAQLLIEDLQEAIKKYKTIIPTIDAVRGLNPHS